MVEVAGEPRVVDALENTRLALGELHVLPRSRAAYEEAFDGNSFAGSGVERVERFGLGAAAERPLDLVATAFQARHEGGASSHVSRRGPWQGEIGHWPRPGRPRLMFPSYAPELA